VFLVVPPPVMVGFFYACTSAVLACFCSYGVLKELKKTHSEICLGINYYGLLKQFGIQAIWGFEAFCFGTELGY
jgi:hypothetical protein